MLGRRRVLATVATALLFPAQPVSAIETIRSLPPEPQICREKLHASQYIHRNLILPSRLQAALQEPPVPSACRASHTLPKCPPLHEAIVKTKDRGLKLPDKRSLQRNRSIGRDTPVPALGSCIRSAAGKNFVISQYEASSLESSSVTAASTPRLGPTSRGTAVCRRS